MRFSSEARCAVLQAKLHWMDFLPAAIATLLALVTLCVNPGVALAQTDDSGDEAAEVQRTIILDTAGSWRILPTLAPPILDGENGLEPVLRNSSWIDQRTADPADGWQNVDFQDSGWVRGPVRIVNDSPYVARLALRGRFKIADPAKVSNDLHLKVVYCGGVRVTLNGIEVGRGNLAEGPVTAETLAEAYPEEAFVTEKGQLDTYRGRGPYLSDRTLELTIPAKLLRAGDNILALDIVRAPYHRIHHEKPALNRGKKEVLVMHWGTCQIKRVQLTADGVIEGLVGGGTRPKGIHAWNSDTMRSDFDVDFGNPAESLQPIRLAGARRGTYSGKVVVGSDSPIRNLRAEISALQPVGQSSGAAAIGSDAAKIRYSLPWGGQALIQSYRGHFYPYPVRAEPLDALAEKPLEEIPVREKPTASDYRPQDDDPAPTPGAVAGVWVTVTIPEKAAAGNYAGKMTITADGGFKREVPVELTVLDWTLPEPQDYHAWVELIQSPDTLALTYDVELWSEEHWAMIAQSMKLISGSGSRVLHVPLIARTNLGNDQSMIHWKALADGNYEVDYSRVERYIDTALKHMGWPKIVCFWVWDIYMREDAENSRSDHLWLKQAIEARRGLIGKGPLVTLVDAKTGELSTDHLAPLAAPVSKKQWQPVFDRLHKLMDDRGIRDAMTLGMLSDVRPSKEDVQFFHELSPDTPWMGHSHHTSGLSRPLYGIARVRYEANVWGLSFASDPEKPMHGWNSPYLKAEYDRSRGLNSTPPINWHYMTEANIVGRQRGIGRLGADFWPSVPDGRGALRGYAWSRFLHSSWRNLDIHSHILAAGPEGPVGTARFEVLREGVQNSEARIAIERALLDESQRERLGEKFAAELEKFLADRVTAMYRGQASFQMNNPNSAVSWRGGAASVGPAWFMTSGWQQSSARLHELAGEVQKRLGGKR